MKINFKQVFLLLVMVVLSLPIIQSLVPIVLEKNLKGYFEVKSKPILNSQDYFSGKFQEDYMTYLNDHLPLRATITRLYNQILYSVFTQSTLVDLKIGENGYFYDHPYIKEYNGEQFRGLNVNKEKVDKLVEINKYLESIGKKLIIVFAPGKASMFPEYIPDELKKKNPNLTY